MGSGCIDHFVSTENEEHATESPLSTLHLRRRQVSTISLNDNCRDYIDDKCDRFNRYAEFVDKNAASELSIKQANIIRQTVSEIDKIIQDAECAIRDRMSRLLVNVDKFAINVGDSATHWYRSMEDITALNDAKFVDMLTTMRIPDVRDFAAYLEETLPIAARKQRPEYEFMGRTFVGKVHLLLERVLHLSRLDYSTVLAVFISVKAKVFLPSIPRIHQRYLMQERPYIDDTIHWLVDQHTKEDLQDAYWNFAVSWRTLVTAWEELPDDPATLLHTLGVLRKKAEYEIRNGAKLAVKGRLPTELLDVICEFAMLAEEIPSENA